MWVIVYKLIKITTFNKIFKTCHLIIEIEGIHSKALIVQKLT